jgi:OmpA-OmpF porin, OOP family
MYKTTKTLRALGRVAPVALAVAMMAPATQAVEQQDSFWFAAGDKSLPDGQLWVNSAGECWQSAYPDGPKNLPPCAPKVVVADEVTLHLNFEFDKYEVPKYVVNKEEVALIDQYIRDIKATPQTEIVTVTGHTDAVGSDAYNMALGQRRADAVRKYIIAQGYPAQNVAPAVSRGKRELLPQYPPDSLQQRRVVLTKTDIQ